MSYNVSEKVFAKIPGRPPWPAFIECVMDAERTRYKVCFMGSCDRAVVKAEDIFPYNENKEKFGKPLKGRSFTDGLMKMQKILNSVTSCHNAVKTNHKKNDTEITEQRRVSRSGRTIKPKRFMDFEELKKRDVRALSSRFHRKGKSSVKSAKVSKEAVVTSDSSTIFEADNGDTKHLSSTEATKHHMKTGQDVRVTEDTKVTEDINVYEDISDTADVNITEDDSIIENVCSSEDLGVTENTNDYENITVTTEDASVTNNELSVIEDITIPDIVAISPDDVIFKLQAIDDRQVLFKDPPLQDTWRDEAMESLGRLHSGIVYGTLRCESNEEVNACLTDPSIFTVEICHSTVDVDDAYVREARDTLLFLQSIIYLRDSLVIDEYDLDRALAVLMKLNTLNISAFALKKFKFIFHTLHQVSNFIGKREGLSSEELEVFHNKTLEIKQISKEIIRKMEDLFPVPEGSTFMEEYARQLELFQQATSHMTEEEIVQLQDDPTMQGSGDDVQAREDIVTDFPVSSTSRKTRKKKNKRYNRRMQRM